MMFHTKKKYSVLRTLIIFDAFALFKYYVSIAPGLGMEILLLGISNHRLGYFSKVRRNVLCPSELPEL